MGVTIKSTQVERFLKSFAFSVILFLAWGMLTLMRIPSPQNIEPIEILWFLYNLLISLLFLIRRRPSVVSMDAVHWTVALLTSFSGYFLSKLPENPYPAMKITGDILIVAGLALGIASAVALGRNYDVLPAQRGVSTVLVYKAIRHPMYLSSMTIKLGYILLHPSWFNTGLFILVVYLYFNRAIFEEEIMKQNQRYIDYMKCVRCRFIPGLI